MDNTREKLIELVRDALLIYGYESHPQRKPDEFIADHLIANGVTVQQWIPVTERLPEMQTYTSDDPNDYWEYDCSQMVLAYTDDGVRVVECCKDNVGLHWCTEGGTDYNVTHWMPLPEPPKGE